MKYGFTDNEIKTLKSLLRNFNEIDSALIFGSRALETYEKGSDVDIALKGNITSSTIASLKSEIDDTTLPYFFDILDYENIQEPKLKEQIDRHGKVFYVRGWEETTLGEVADIQTGPFGSQLHNKDYVQIGTPIITVENLINDSIEYTRGTPKVSNKDKARLYKYTLQRGDIVFSRVGSVDRCAYVSEKENGWLFSGRLLRVRPKKLLFDKYTFYWISQESIKEYVRKIAVGATMPSINTALLAQVPISFPSIHEQHAIAAVLSSFDDKIELLSEQNKTLEATAQAIYKEWFVKFNYPGASGKIIDSELGEIPEEWRVGKLTEILDFMKGIEPGSNNYSVKKLSEDYLPFYRVQDIANYNKIPNVFVDQELLKGKIFKKDDILISLDGTIGRVFIGGSGGYSSGIRKVIEKEKFISKFLIYCFLKSDKFQGELNSFAGAETTIKHAGGAIKHIKFVFEKSVCEQFGKATDSLFQKLISNIFQIQTLARLRDTLLPKLMKGEIRVKRFNR